MNKYNQTCSLCGCNTGPLANNAMELPVTEGGATHSKIVAMAWDQAPDRRCSECGCWWSALDLQEDREQA